MIAKLVVWGEDRCAALKKLRYCLRQYNVGQRRVRIDRPSPKHLAGDVCAPPPAVFRSWDWTLTLTSCWVFRAIQSSRRGTWAPASSRSTTLTSSLPPKLLRGKRCARRPWAWCCRRGNTRRSSHRSPTVRPHQHSWWPLCCFSDLTFINLFLQICSLLLAPAAAGETTFSSAGTWPCSWGTKVSRPLIRTHYRPLVLWRERRAS